MITVDRKAPVHLNLRGMLFPLDHITDGFSSEEEMLYCTPEVAELSLKQYRNLSHSDTCYLKWKFIQQTGSLHMR